MSNTTDVSPGLPPVETAGTLALPNLDGVGHEDPIVDATPITSGTPAHGRVSGPAGPGQSWR